MKKPKAQPAPQEAPRNTALGGLLAAKGFAASAPAPAAAPAAKSDFDLSKAGKIVLRRERKGRGGKTVTVVSGLPFPANRLEEVARAMRKDLGCGSTVEGNTVVLQGELGERAQAWLKARGAQQTVLGN